MSLSALSIMVVEDHGFQRRMALRLLAELGISQVSQAADGIGALLQLDELEHVPDVVLVDLDMPGMDGIEFIGHLAQRRLARAVVVVSALDAALLNTVQTMARAYGLRVLGSVEKPLTLDKLATALEDYVHGPHDDADDEPVEISASSIREALAAGEIEPWYQPQVEFANGRVVGVEALARWVRPDGHVVGPVHFVPLLEREGLLEALTDHMLTRACRDKRRWDQQGLDLTLSVNVSPTSLTLNSAADRYQRLVEAEGVDPAAIILDDHREFGHGRRSARVGGDGAPAAEGLRAVDR
ncbi:EAL domain-containing protein [Aerolutibacter ruishenii]|uniref:Response regulator receiver domain-containing protein n=1 Tax=Aerolutibacter ruishenii TaxID=686800 RepID=A0A562M0M3_9GAMM|nr:EAL domain-containing response regulator [Lysobacter ruishenii]TWI13494.1 response regulator receiver domain-containing protein [Lysobacter ruishenii]